MPNSLTSASATARSWRTCVRATVFILILLVWCNNSSAYSVLTHEEIVDLLWTAEIQPLLLKRFPGLSEDQIRGAHAFAYGGAVIQDLGYYPFGSQFFSHLTHSSIPACSEGTCPITISAGLSGPQSFGQGTAPGG